MRKCGKILSELKKSIGNWYKRITVRVFAIILLCVLPFNYFAFLQSNLIIEKMKTEVVLSAQSVLENVAISLQNRITFGNYLLLHVLEKGDIADIMLSQTDDDHYEVYKSVFFRAFAESVSLSDGFDKYFFIIKEKGDILLLRSDTQEKEWLGEEYEEGKLEKGWSLKKINDRECMCLYMEIKGMGCGGWIYLDEVQQLLMKEIRYKNASYTFAYGEEGEQQQGIGLKSLLIAGDIYLHTYLDEAEILGTIRFSRAKMWIMTILQLFLLPVLYLLIHYLLIHPLKRLEEGFRHVERGDLDYRITDTASSLEYEHSFQAFNTMQERLKAQIEENYKNVAEKERMELQNLQLQIRPHFLLNTFNLMYALVKKKESAAIQEIIMYLSDYFRYIFREGKSLELFQREQVLIEGYINMAQIHYPGSIQIEYSYDPEIMLLRVPPLLLHNFVENIVKHVVRNGRITHISVIGQYEDGHVTFLIIDDGQGISEEKLKEIDDFMRQDRQSVKHAGFSNSFKRIKYFYGEEADIIISSEVGEGTCIKLTFPYDLEVLKNNEKGTVGYETFDCE